MAACVICARRACGRGYMRKCRLQTPANNRSNLEYQYVGIEVRWGSI
jgi:hypothetical protein